MKIDEERLASRYWDLLDFYPKRYRRERGPELVGTLLDGARPDQTRPSWREARALILEGLRVRAGTGGYRSRGATVAGGVRLGLLVLLVGSLLSNVSAVVGERAHEDVRPVTPGWSVLFGLAVLAMMVPFALLARGRVRLALPFVIVAGAVEMAGFQWLHRSGWADPPVLPPEWTGILPVYLDPATATVLIAGTLLLIWLRPPAVGRPGVVAAVLPPLLFWTPEWLRGAGPVPDDLDVALWPVIMLAFVLGYVGIVAYSAVDARPAVAVATLVSVLAVQTVVLALKWGLDVGMSAGTVVYLLVLGVPVGVAVWLGARRQARLPTPGATA